MARRVSEPKRKKQSLELPQKDHPELPPNEKITLCGEIVYKKSELDFRD